MEFTFQSGPLFLSAKVLFHHLAREAFSSLSTTASRSTAALQIDLSCANSSARSPRLPLGIPLSAAWLPLPLLPRCHANSSDLRQHHSGAASTAAKTGHKPATLGWVGPPRPASTEVYPFRPPLQEELGSSSF